jgi:hypothetical protein
VFLRFERLTHPPHCFTEISPCVLFWRIAKLRQIPDKSDDSAQGLSSFSGIFIPDFCTTFSEKCSQISPYETFSMHVKKNLRMPPRLSVSPQAARQSPEANLLTGLAPVSFAPIC